MELGYGLAIATEFNDWNVIGNQREYYSRLSLFPFSPYNFTYHSPTPFMEPIIAYRASLHSSHLPVPVQTGESPTGFSTLGHKHILYVERSANYKVVEYHVHKLLK